MILNPTVTFDLGNTHIVAGYFQDGRLRHTWRLRTQSERTADDYRVAIEHLFSSDGVDRAKIDHAALCSVVPDLTEGFAALCQHSFGVNPVVLEPQKQQVIGIDYDRPEDVGADRIANAIALRADYGLPGIVVDLGTATTVDAVSAEGVYLGGAIVPGVLVSLEALIRGAARLTGVDLVTPQRALGKNTDESVRAGVVYGYADQIEGLVRRVAAEMDGSPVVVATGGLCGLICSHVPSVKHCDSDLTIKGLFEFLRVTLAQD